MLLTKSFFNPALLRSDLRRCWPLFAGYTFLWFLILPLRMWNDVPADLQAAHPYEARSVALEIIANATTAAIWIHLIFGIVLAMALFSYLSSARGTYGMHSFPASRGCQFRTHLLSCVGCVAVSNVLICLLSAQSGGTHWGASLSWLVFSLVTFLLFFSLGVFCCMLCGWLPAMAVAYGAVNCVVIFCRILADAMCSTFYPSYNDTAFSMGRDHIVVWLTPVLRLHQNLYEGYNNGSPLLSAGTWKSLLVYGIAALVLLAAGALLYRIRRSEASGDTLAFRPLRPVVRWVVGILGGLGLGLVLAAILSCTKNTPALLACIVTLGLACMIVTQMLIARTPRVFGKLWPELLALCAVLLALTLCIKADLFGFERRIPQTDQVESVVVYQRAIYGSKARITDPEEIDAIVQAHRYLADCAAKENLGSDWLGKNTISITYHLKNGGTLARQYQLRDEDRTAVRAMLESETFRRSLVLDDVNVNADALRHGYITNFAKERRRELTAQECRLLYQTLLEDIAHMNMLDRDLYDYQDPCLDIMLEDDEKTISARLNPQCTRTLALLQEWGLIGSPGEAFGATDKEDAEDTIAYSGGIPSITIA